MIDAPLPPFLEKSTDLKRILDAILVVARQQWLSVDKPYLGRSVKDQEKLLNHELPQVGHDLLRIIDEVGSEVVRHSVIIRNPKAIAHFHCTPTLASQAAELIIALTNQSMDSWDQSPSATMIELLVVRWLCALMGWTSGAGVFTAGGTMANQMAVLLARNFLGKKELGIDLQRVGLCSDRRLNRFCMIAGEQSHFSVRRAAGMVGLGEQAVILVPTDRSFRLQASAIERRIRELKRERRIVIMVVGTAGTTAQGTIDELQLIAKVCRETQAWFHVDASHGGALLFSERYKHLVQGIEEADSIALDPHKFLFQNISCSCFLLKDKERFSLIDTHVDYLNPPEDETEGVCNLVGRSIQTTRRFDALKLFMTIEHLGVKGMARLIDGRIDLTMRCADMVRKLNDLEMAFEPITNVLAFRFRPDNVSASALNEINRQLAHRLFVEGYAVLSRVRFEGDLYLKASILNPDTTETELREVLAAVRRLGADIMQNMQEPH